MNRQFYIKTIFDKYIIHIIAFVFSIFQLTFYQQFEFHRDELLYFSLSEHLDIGYYSVPPFIGLVAYISIKLFGYSLFATKFFPAIAGGIFIYLISQITKEFKGKLYAQILVAITGFFSLLFVRAFGLFQPVPFDIFFWTLSLYLILRYFNSQNKKYLIFFGLSIGIGFLNKYNIAFLVIALFLSILLTKHRKIFLSKYLYIAATITFLLILPNIIWQIKYNFPVVKHMTELNNSQLVNMNPLTFLVEQLLMIFPSTLIVIPGIIALLFSKHFKDYKIFGYFSIIVILIFLALNGKNYYTAGIYPLIIAFSGVSTEKFLSNRYLRSIIVLIIIFLGFLILPMGKPIYKPNELVNYFDKTQRIIGTDAIRRDEDNNYNKLPQDYADMLGWEELTKISNEAYNLIENKNNCIIYCENYGQAGAITIIGKKYKLPQPISFSDNFKYWLPVNFKNEITETIYINTEMGDDVKELFSEIIVVGEITNPLAREFGTKVYLCKKPTRSFNEFWQEIKK